VGRVEGKVVLVSGAAQGIGASHVAMLAAEGATVVALDVQDDLGRQVAAAAGAQYMHVDVVDPADWARAVQQSVDRFSRIDVLVNNAAVSGFACIFDATVQEFRRTMEINVLGVFNGIQAVAAVMKAAGHGSIINTSSISGMKGSNHLHAYTASKWAIRGLTKSVALDLAPHGIRVNSVHPGQILTPAAAGFTFPVDHVAMGRPGTPEEISELVVFLASDASRFCTGSEFVADGGELAGMPQSLM
jgi:3alpha(or 20beta)-hydroxysteroid dehydrogenase